MRDRLNTTQVAVAAIQNKNGQILLSKRHPGSHQGNLWEFPGGKLESGESVVVALHRELKEELGIRIIEYRPLIRVRHEYHDLSVSLNVYLVTDWQGEPRAMENQPLRWVMASNLDAYAMPAADTPIIRALQLPSVYLITQPQVTDADQYLEKIRHALKLGVRLLQFRVFGLEEPQHNLLARLSRDLCHEFGARMLINHDLQLAEAIAADGVHLNRRQLQSLSHRPLTNLVAASCHSLVELRQAYQLGVDFAVLSPVLPTQSHPDAEPLGWNAFAEMVDQINMPVYALGGMALELRKQAWMRGAQGVSGIRMILNSYLV